MSSGPEFDMAFFDSQFPTQDRRVAMFSANQRAVELVQTIYPEDGSSINRTKLEELVVIGVDYGLDAQDVLKIVTDHWHALHRLEEGNNG